ncbi:Hypp8026 [Branchiostoma lanceolatum]|uniref:Hypp8026 protein n=1 Tax=Branchiostoma lanceolatum TaxID=7740 RepID=A0A8K0EGQ6_BRALA|nr:Hypp8026 [Branchiostoma lanceolatum]
MAYLRQVHCKSIYTKMGHHNGTPTSIDDFEPVKDKVPVANPAQFFRDHGRDYFVCCADFQNMALVLVKPKDITTVKTAPFFREALRQQTEELLVIPFSQLARVAAEVASDVAPITTILLYHTTRCGSTLLIKALEASGLMHTVSEPDVFISFCRNVYPEKDIPEDDMKMVLDVIRHTNKLFNYTLFQQDPSKTVTCYKTRGQDCVIADLLQRALPDVKNIFLYRDLVSTVDSYTRLLAEERYWKYWILASLGLDSVLVSNGVGVSPAPPWENPSFASTPVPHGVVWFYACLWLVIMQSAHKLTKTDTHQCFHVILRYEEVCKYKEEIVLKIIDDLGIKCVDEDAKLKMKEAFGVNSQVGHNLASKGLGGGKCWMGDWERGIMSKILDHTNTGINRSDFELNGTLTQI